MAQTGEPAQHRTSRARSEWDLTHGGGGGLAPLLLLRLLLVRLRRRTSAWVSQGREGNPRVWGLYKGRASAEG